jgi:mono/diheme cytochrome c family protein
MLCQDPLTSVNSQKLHEWGYSMLRRMFSLAMVASLAVLFLTITRNASAQKGDAAAAMQVFKKECVRCHGEQGKGDGPAGKLLKVKPADWSDTAKMSKLTDQELTTVISKGGTSVGKSPLMPGFASKLKPEDIQNLIALIRQMSGKK